MVETIIDDLDFKENQDENDSRELEEVMAISTGGAGLTSSGQISGTGGNPLGGDMSDQHEIMWSGDKPVKKKEKPKKINESTDIDSKKLHYTENKIEKIKSVSQGPSYKPDGFWYSCGREWERWASVNMYPMDSIEYVYSLETSSRVLLIDNKEKFHNFEQEFLVDASDKKSDIDWDRVTEQYSGIEICPHQSTAEYYWYLGWDIASGCVWDSVGVSNIELVYTRPEKKLDEEFIGNAGGLSHFQMGGSLPDELYNRTVDGKPTRKPGVDKIKKKSTRQKKNKNKKKEKVGDRWYDEKNAKSLFRETYISGAGSNQKDYSTGVEGGFPALNQIFYHGTNKEFAVGDYILPPNETGEISEKGRKKNLDKVFYTLDVGSAKIYAGRAVQSAGNGSPYIYKIQPIGDIEWLNKAAGTTVAMSPSAKVLEKI